MIALKGFVLIKFCGIGMDRTLFCVNGYCYVNELLCVSTWIIEHVIQFYKICLRNLRYT